MRGVNKVILIGNLGRDPETRYSQAGNAVTTFSVATSETWTKDGQKQERTEWHNCVAFSRLAEIAGEYLRKGSKVYIEGKLQTDTYEKDGEKRYSTKVNVRELQMLTSKREAPNGTPDSGHAPTPAPEFEDDIPFAPEWRV